MMSRLALATSIAHAAVGIGHTVSLLPPTTSQENHGSKRTNNQCHKQFFGIDVFSKPEWKSLPKLLFAYSRVGWYQGGAFFTIIGTYMSTLYTVTGA